MSRYHFSAFHISDKNNILFPDEIIIDDEEQKLIYRKGQIIGHKETTLRFAAIGCASIKAGLLFSDIYIETKGGKIIQARGFSKSDARKIVRLLS